MKKFALIILYALSAGVQADWYSRDNTDQITGQHTVSAFYNNYYYGDNSVSLGVRCDESTSIRRLSVTFDAGSAIDVPRSEINMFVKVDKNPPISLKGHLYTNSYSAGYVQITDEIQNDTNKLITQMINGYEAYVKLQDDDLSNIQDFYIDLKGFTAKSKKTLNTCEFTPNSQKMNEADKNRLAQIDTKIKMLQKEKADIQAKY